MTAQYFCVRVAYVRNKLYVLENLRFGWLMISDADGRFLIVRCQNNLLMSVNFFLRARLLKGGRPCVYVQKVCDASFGGRTILSVYQMSTGYHSDSTGPTARRCVVFVSISNKVAQSTQKCHQKPLESRPRGRRLVLFVRARRQYWQLPASCFVQVGSCSRS